MYVHPSPVAFRAAFPTSALSLGGSALVAAALALGCAGSEGDDVLSGGTGASSSTGGAGAVGGAAGAGNEGGSASLCGQDCSKIDTPPCLDSVCNEGQYPGQVGSCTVVPSETGTACDDGLFCTANDYCEAGECQGGPQNDCGMTPPPCEVVTCVESTQSCTTAPSEPGAPCIPGNLCEVNGTCQNGLCVGNPKDCSFSPHTECNAVSCNPSTGACEPTPDPAKNGASCALTGDPCMVDKTCNAGACVGGVPKDCSAFTSGCNIGTCEAQTGACFGDPIGQGDPCTDGIPPCNVGFCSSAGTCDPVPTPGVACSNGIGFCQVGVCSNAGTCDASPANEGLACADATSCTVGNACASGVCGIPNPGYELYFSETFADNSQGWTLGPEWGIGPAVAGPTGNCEDPGLDVTPTADNGIAGVAIGGCSPSSVAGTLHPFYYLTSPVFNTAVASGQVWLQFYRWLESDYTSFMNNVIEVYDGTAWIKIWESGSTGIHDAPNWQFISHDITAYKNAHMQIRFGFDIGATGVFQEGSWNVDDVTIASALCP